MLSGDLCSNFVKMEVMLLVSVQCCWLSVQCWKFEINAGSRGCTRSARAGPLSLSLGNSIGIFHFS